MSSTFDINDPLMKPYRDGTFSIGKDFSNSQGPYRDFVRLLHSCPDDNLTREQTAATVVLAFWQAAGRVWTRNLPSVLRVHASPASDPLEELARSSIGKGTSPEAHSACDQDSAMDPRSMLCDVVRRYDALYTKNPLAADQWVNDQGSKLWQQKKRQAFGTGRTGRYSDMWDPELGLMTDDDGSIILHIDREQDFAHMCADIANYPDHFTETQGRCSMKVAKVLKSSAVSGSITPLQWSADIVNSILEEGLPFLFLPHATEPAAVKMPAAWFLTSMNFEKMIRGERNVPPDITGIKPVLYNVRGHLGEVENALRQRLIFLPTCYEFFVRNTLRHLPGACSEIARFLAPPQSIELTALFLDLVALTARGIALGVESLVYHGAILYQADELKTVQAVLSSIRENGSTTRRNIQRKVQKLTAEQLDTLLSKLATAGVITLEGRREVHAVAFDTFVRSLAAQPSYRPVKLKTSALIKKWDKEKLSKA